MQSTIVRAVEADTTETAERVELRPETLLAYAEHIASVDSAEQIAPPDRPFLWSDSHPEIIARLRKGAAVCELYSGKRPIRVPDGLIHDWIGAVTIPGATIEQTLAAVQDYDNHKNMYRPEVMDSKLIGREGNDFQVYLRLRKKKIITVILDTEHDVRYVSMDSGRWSCRSSTTRVCEVEDGGKPGEKVHPPDTGYGFLWRLSSYWRFAEGDNSVTVECRAISLTRDIPKALAWMLNPMVLKLPKESLESTLEATRRAVQSRSAQS